MYRTKHGRDEKIGIYASGFCVYIAGLTVLWASANINHLVSYTRYLANSYGLVGVTRPRPIACTVARNRFLFGFCKESCPRFHLEARPVFQAKPHPEW